MTKTNSPTPWRVEERDGEVQVWHHDEPRPGHITHRYCVAVMNGRPCDELRVEAALIVEAVNAHASQSARIAELEAALAGMCDDADATYRGIAHGSTAPISLGQFGRLATALALLPKLEAR